MVASDHTTTMRFDREDEGWRHHGLDNHGKNRLTSAYDGWGALDSHDWGALDMHDAALCAVCRGTHGSHSTMPEAYTPHVNNISAAPYEPSESHPPYPSKTQPKPSIICVPYVTMDTNADGEPSAWAEQPSAWAKQPSAWAEQSSAWAEQPSAWAEQSSAWAELLAWAKQPPAWPDQPSAWADQPSAWPDQPSAWAERRWTAEPCDASAAVGEHEAMAPAQQSVANVATQATDTSGDAHERRFRQAFPHAFYAYSVSFFCHSFIGSRPLPLDGRTCRVVAPACRIFRACPRRESAAAGVA